MIENERQYYTAQEKLTDLERDLAYLDAPNDLNLHPRQLLARRNSLNIVIGELRQEIAKYEESKSGWVYQER